jgi:hypothetical protein
LLDGVAVVQSCREFPVDHRGLAVGVVAQQRRASEGALGNRPVVGNQREQVGPDRLGQRLAVGSGVGRHLRQHRPQHGRAVVASDRRRVGRRRDRVVLVRRRQHDVADPV